jgi:hypothetical protein
MQNYIYVLIYENMTVPFQCFINLVIKCFDETPKLPVQVKVVLYRPNIF